MKFEAREGLRIRAQPEQMNHISSCQNFFAHKVPFIPFREQLFFLDSLRNVLEQKAIFILILI